MSANKVPTEQETLREIFRLCSRTVQPEDGSVQGWEPTCARRIQVIMLLAARMLKRIPA